MGDAPRRASRRRVAFAELVALRAWGDKVLFYEACEDFELREGEFVDSYWCERPPGGVALTEKQPAVLLRRLGRTSETRLHRMTEELVRNEPEFARLLLEIDRYVIRVSNVLSGMSRRIALFTLFALTRNILTYLEDAHERQRPADADHESMLQAHRKNLADFRRYYDEAAVRQAQIVYFIGMLGGSVMIAMAAVGLGFLFTHINVPGVNLTLFIGCLISGGIGAVMSVLIRMSSGAFDVNHEVGREYLKRLGSFRPAIGAIFALVLYFAITGGLIPQVSVPQRPSEAFAFFLAVGFAVGFSERLAKETLASIESGAGGGRSAGKTAASHTPSIPSIGAFTSSSDDDD
jgi:hypothetical protein